MKDYYKILGVNRDASQDDIKKAYRQLALQHHPDKNHGDKASEERFKEISESYIILGDVPKRNAYDFARDNKGHQFEKNVGTPGQATPTMLLTLFKRVKNKVLNAGGHINEYRLFTVLDDLLSDETINLLLTANDIVTNNMILDEIVVTGIFLSDESRLSLHSKLLRLADGDIRFIQKIEILTRPSEKRINQNSTSQQKDNEDNRPIFFLILFMFLLILLLLF